MDFTKAEGATCRGVRLPSCYRVWADPYRSLRHVARTLCTAIAQLGVQYAAAWAEYRRKLVAT